MKHIGALVLVALLLGGCGGDDGGADAGTASRSGGAAVAAATSSGGSQGVLSQDSVTRKVIVDSSMRLEVPQLREAYFEVNRLTRTLGGYVAESSIDDTSGDNDGAHMRLRVPAARHDDLMDGLRKLGGGRVLKESTSAREVTEEYSDLESRLRNLQRTEAQYQELLKQARTIDEILNVQTRLDTVRGQIEQAQGRLKLLDSLVDFATVSLDLRVHGASASEGIPRPGEVFADSWDGAVVVARMLLNLGVVVFVAALWLALPALLVFLGIRFSDRRRARSRAESSRAGEQKDQTP